MRRSILLIAALLLLLGAPAFARPGESEERTKEEWEKQRDEERKTRQKKLRDALKGKSPQEREEILKKLKELEGKELRDRLREKQKRYEAFRTRLVSSLAAPIRSRYDELGEDHQRDLVLHFMRRTWEAGSQRFMESLSEEERGTLEGASGRERRRKLREISDRRVLAGLSLDDRKQLDALAEPERQRRFAVLRTEYITRKTTIVEKEVVFPEAAALLSKPKAEIEELLEKTRRVRKPGSRVDDRGLADERPHHRPGHRFPDRELHELMHRIPEKHWKAVDDEFLRIVTKTSDDEARKKALEDLKTRLREHLAD